METLQSKFISTVLGASSSATGLLALSKCSNGSCTSCFGCAGAGIGILLLVLFSRMKINSKEETHGMAERRS